MRTSIYVIILVVLPVFTFAQFQSSTSTKIKSATTTTINLNKTNSIIKLSPANLTKLKNSRLTKDLKRIPYIPSPEELERNRVKNWSVTPVKPYTAGLEMSILGKFDKDGFLVHPIGEMVTDPTVRDILGNYVTTWIPVEIKARLLAGKDYRLTFTIKNVDIPARGKIILALGDEDVYEFESKPGEYAYKVLFSATKNETRDIGISLPYAFGEDGLSADFWSYYIKSVQLEELVPAQ